MSGAEIVSRARALGTVLPRKRSRLESSARTLLAKAEASLSQDRTTNTRRRAEHAAGAVAVAQKQALRAKVALAIVEAGGKLGPASIASLKDLELLEIDLSRATGWLADDRRTDEGDAAAAERAIHDHSCPSNEKWVVDAWQERRAKLREMDIVSTPLLREALSALVALRASVGRSVEDPVRALERRLVGFTSPGFFPTPRPIAVRMAELADIGPGMVVLEPSAGSGRLADAARDRGGFVTCVEINHTLCDLLVAKGHHHVCPGDFLELPFTFRYAAILMNPPFENGQDAIHVSRAFELLKPGGRLVAITGEGIWFREDRAARDFRAWIETVDVFHNEKLPAGTFNQSDVTQRTGVAARLVAIRKGAA